MAEIIDINKHREIPVVINEATVPLMWHICLALIKMHLLSFKKVPGGLKCWIEQHKNNLLSLGLREEDVKPVIDSLSIFIDEMEKRFELMENNKSPVKK